ncbi:MAG: hypothetical protein E7566_06620 [Ruminococcaceae bacterium]|nr:hypothetical protein [Oscillospiraceae bacterium]
MTYVVSDLHGYPVERIGRKLSEIGFSPEDNLYVLGDCIDRGSDGLKIIRWIMSCPNVILLMGNHESMLLKNRGLFEGDRIPCASELTGAKRNYYSVWVSNGGFATMDAMQQYTHAQIRYMLDYIEKAPLYKEIEVGGKKYILCHSGLGDFNTDKKLSDYSEYDLLWSRPSLETRYYEDGTIVVFGHTPTTLYGSKFKNKPVFTDTWIDIDVGAGLGLSPMILRLDDMKEFYF